MSHRIESEHLIPVSQVPWAELPGVLDAAPEVVLLSIPPLLTGDPLPVDAPGSRAVRELGPALRAVAERLPPGGELVLYGEPLDLVHLREFLPDEMRYHLWAAVRTEPGAGPLLERQHRSLLFLGKNVSQLRHSRVRIAYQFCPACDRTTKDYGGRKHLYDSFGTLVSDVWKDEAAPHADPLPGWVVERVAGLLSSHGRRLMVASTVAPDREDVRGREGAAEEDGRGNAGPPGDAGAGSADEARREARPPGDARRRWVHAQGELWNGDSVELLSSVPDDSIGLAFADPPYNLAKPYGVGDDRRQDDQYLRWCDRWLCQYIRDLRPGGTLAVLNLPWWAAAHARVAHREMEFVNWIVWESMSLPARQIMPSHYALLLFRKPGGCGSLSHPTPQGEQQDLLALRAGYCLRPGCVRSREITRSHELAGDLWSDIHRVKHNSARRDHPCQLPPRFLRRLLAACTAPGDLVLDAFNGIGTTSLVAHQMERRFLGMELNPEYHASAVERHHALLAGTDPFEARAQIPLVKNNRVRRQTGARAGVSKKEVQLAVKGLAEKLGRLPTREEALDQLPYPPEIYSSRFKSWSEVSAAARTSGMTEARGSTAATAPGRGRDRL